MLSVRKCNEIGKKEKYSFEELESFDSLTSKFARTSDIFTQKILRTILILLREPQQSFIDIANKSEKLNIIVSAESLIKIRDLRNEIAHEYIEEELFKLFENVLNIAEDLIKSINKTTKFIREKFNK